MAEVTLRGLTKQFGSIAAVHAMDLTIANREFFVLLGPSRCGKTTTLRMVAGLDEASDGSIVIGGRMWAMCHSRTFMNGWVLRYVMSRTTKLKP